MNSKSNTLIVGRLIEFNKIYEKTTKKEDQEYLLLKKNKNDFINDLFVLERKIKTPYKESLRRQRSILTNNKFNKLIYDEIFAHKNNRFNALKKATEKFLNKENKESLNQIRNSLTIIMLNEEINKTNEDVILAVNNIDYFYMYNLSNKVKALISYQDISCKETIKLLAKRKIPFIKYNNRLNQGDQIIIKNNEILINPSREIYNNLLKTANNDFDNEECFLYKIPSSLNNLNNLNNKKQFYEQLFKNNRDKIVKIKLNNFTKNKNYFHITNIKEKEFNLFGPFQTVYFKELEAILKAHQKYKNAQIVIPSLYDVKQYNHLLDSIEIINKKIGNEERIKVGIIMDSKKHYQKMINFRNVDFVYIDLKKIVKDILEIEEDDLEYYIEDINELYKEMKNYFLKNEVVYYLKNDFKRFDEGITL